MKSLDPFSLESEIRQIKERLDRIEMFIGTEEGHYSESSLDSRLERVEDWRRDQNG